MYLPFIISENFICKHIGAAVKINILYADVSLYIPCAMLGILI